MSDLISREAVLERAETSTFTDKNEKRKFIDWLNYCLEQPTVEAVQVVHGEWRHLGGDEWGCTECGHVITTEGSWEKPTKKFCEECGADMRKKVK